MLRRITTVALGLALVACTALGANAERPEDRCQPWPGCKHSPTVLPSPSIEPVPEPSPSAEPSPTPEPSPSPAPGAKPVPTGLSTSGFSSPFYTTAYDVATLNLYWDLVEPERDVMRAWVLDNALDAAEAAGVTQVRIRPFLGMRAPTWAKALGDGPIPYVEPQDGSTSAVPDVWDPAYQAEVEELLAWLAGRVDDDPRVPLVFATGAMTAFGEPMIRGIASADNRRALLVAGYTKDADRAAQRWQLDAMRPFEHTLIGLAYNPWQYVNADGTGGTSLAETEAVMDYHTALLPARAVLTNHSIRSSYIPSPPPLYTLFRARTQWPHQFQTAAASRIGDLRATLGWADDYLNATVVETYGGAWNTLTAAEIDEYDSRYRANL